MKQILFKIQRMIGRYPTLYFPLYALFGKKKYLAINSDTEIVIEGYPRSANSFSVVAFENAQRHNVKIAHHLHIPAQVIQGTRQGIPVLVLLRHPVSAICSLVVREPHLNLQTALDDYIHFHKRILPYRKHYHVARFEDITSDFSRVIGDLNKKFGTDFCLFKHSQDNIKNVFSNLETLEKNDTSGTLTDEKKVARPSSIRKESYNIISEQLESERYKKPLATAIELYNKILNMP